MENKIHQNPLYFDYRADLQFKKVPLLEQISKAKKN